MSSVVHVTASASIPNYVAALTDLSAGVAQAAAVLESRTQARFDTKTDPNGLAWLPWSSVTAAQRAKEGRGTLLEYTGRMRTSISAVASGNEATVGIYTEYAAAHEYGNAAKNIPARHMLTANGTELAAADMEAAQSAFTRWLETRL